MHVLVTGGAGFIGSHVVDAFIKRGDDVTILDNLSSGAAMNLNPRAKFVLGDVRDREHHDELGIVDVVVHLAAQIDVQTSITQPDFDASTNIIGTINMLELAKRFGAKLVLASSAAVYNPTVPPPLWEDEITAPSSPYGMSKLAAEGYVNLYNRLHDARHTILRFANVYGPRQGASGEGGVVYHFANALVNGAPPVIYGDGNQTRDFIYVKDVARAVVMAAESHRHDTFNVSTGDQVSLWNLLDAMASYKARHGLRTLPERPGDIKHSALEPTRIRVVLGWRANWLLELGVKATLESMS